MLTNARTDPFRPVQPSERIQILDVLRGFALFGVLLINMTDMAGFGPTSSPATWLDDTTSALFEFFIGGRFKGLFSILFGIGFTIQIRRARDRGTPFLARYLRRTVVLIGFGLLHFLFYPGDILTRYAVLGLLLLPLYRVPTRVVVGLVVVMLSLRVATAPIVRTVPVLDRALTPPNVVRTVEPCRELTTRYYGPEHVYGAGTFRDVRIAMACRFPREAIRYWLRTGRTAELFAYFLLGLLLGRAGVVRRFGEILPRVRRATIAAAAVGFALLGVELALPEPWEATPLFLATVGRFATTIAYGGAIILLFHRPLGRRWLSPLAAMGRLALTVYIGQTLVYSTLFHGYGLGWGIEAGHLALLALAMAIYLTEVFVCNLWLRFFRYGPLEWLWRGLTYLRFPPLLARVADTRLA
jgi:uncharacterized protein